MKKIILALLLSISIFTLFGCSLTSKNSPTDTVKEFLDKYKKEIENLEYFIDNYSPYELVLTEVEP